MPVTSIDKLFDKVCQADTNKVKGLYCVVCPLHNETTGSKTTTGKSHSISGELITESRTPTYVACLNRGTLSSHKWNSKCA